MYGTCLTVWEDHQVVVMIPVQSQTWGQVQVLPQEGAKDQPWTKPMLLPEPKEPWKHWTKQTKFPPHAHQIQSQTQTQAAGMAVCSNFSVSGAEQQWPSPSSHGKCHGGESASKNRENRGWLTWCHCWYQRWSWWRPWQIPMHSPLSKWCRVHCLSQYMGIPHLQCQQRSSVLPLPDLPWMFGPRTVCQRIWPNSIGKFHCLSCSKAGSLAAENAKRNNTIMGQFSPVVTDWYQLWHVKLELQ